MYCKKKNTELIQTFYRSFLCWFTTSTWRFHSNNVSSLLFDSLKREITTFKSVSFFLNKKKRNRRIADDFYIFLNLSLHCKRKALWHFKKKYTDIIDCIYAIFIVLLLFSNFIFWITWYIGKYTEVITCCFFYKSNCYCFGDCNEFDFTLDDLLQTAVIQNFHSEFSFVNLIIDHI